MANIPIADKHDETAVNQHLVPQCYMREWCYNSKKTSVWCYSKEQFSNESGDIIEKVTCVSKQIKKINAISNYYDIKAGCYWAPQEALNEIFGPTMHLKASYEGEVLDTVFKRNNRFGVFDQWEIEDDKGNSLTIDEKNSLKEYFSESRYVFIEKEWDRQYETNWRTYIKDVENKVRQTNAGVNCQKNGNQTKSKLITTDLISEIIKLLIIFDIRGFLSDPFINQKVDEVFDSLDQCISGFSDMELEPDDRMHPMETTTKEAFRHQYILHNCYDILKGNKMSGTAEVMWKTYKQNLVPNFCLTDTAHPFVTSEHPAFVNELPDGKMEHIFVALPTMLISLGRGNQGQFYVTDLKPDEVDECNRIVAKNNNLVISSSNNLNIKRIFSL